MGNDPYEPSTYALKLRIINLEEKVFILEQVVNALMEARKKQLIEGGLN